MTSRMTEAVTVQPGGQIEGLKRERRPIPECGAGEVLVKVRAASLNFRDILIARGHYPLASSAPVVAASDGAGEVEEIGPAVRRFPVGARVVCNFMRDWVSGPLNEAAQRSAMGGELDGWLTERIVVPEHALAVIPDSLSFEEAAAVPCAGVTAWNALVSEGRIHAGQTVLVQGSGGVSVFALQFARMHGARVIATSSSESKLKRLRELGAEFGVNYRDTPDWSGAVREYTKGAGVDHVVEVGGHDTFNQSLRCVKPMGTIAVVGMLTGIEPPVNVIPMLLNHVRANGVFVGPRTMLEQTLAALDATGTRPVVDRVFPFAETQEAYRYLESGAHFGKVVIAI